MGFSSHVWNENNTLQIECGMDAQGQIFESRWCIRTAETVEYIWVKKKVLDNN